jgi:imidazolonepropionase-like amidohydrolase
MRNMNTLKRFGLLIVALGFACVSSFPAKVRANDEVPGAPQDRPIALVGGTIHPVVGADVVGGTIIFEKGKITALGKQVKLPPRTIVVDVAGKHIYPGLFDADTEIGLVEVMAVRATVDYAETGSINPNVRARTAFNPDSEWIPVTRSNGVLTAVSAPLGGLLSGLGSVMSMDGWTWESMTLRGEAAMYVNWPPMMDVQISRMDEIGPIERSRAKVIEQLTTVFADARAYAKLKAARTAQSQPAPDFDARWEAMIPVLERKTPLFVRADDLRQIQSAVAFARKENVKLAIIGGYHAAECAELLKGEDVPVIIKGVQRLPRHRGDAYDAPFTLPAKLHAAGVKFCISSSDRMANIRNVPYHAATAAAYGLPVAEALKSVTLYPAQILGVADRIGSLEKGKDATLIVTTGDPLEIATHVTKAYIGGREVDLNDRHKRLWHKYQEKYRQLDATSDAQ